MFRRMRNRNQQGNLLNPEQMALLVNANQLMKDVKPAEAAPLFAQLATALENQRHPRRAANLYARAAHAFADSHNEAGALAQARRALTLFLKFQMNQRSPVFFANIMNKLNSLGMKTSADLLNKEFSNRIGSVPSGGMQGRPARTGLLPTNCPKCGAPVGTEVEWVDEHSAECDYCGTMLRAT
jgi:hypothetical protein